MIDYGTVSDIYVYSKHAPEGIRAMQAQCVRGLGIWCDALGKGITRDAYPKGRERQVILQAKGLKEWMSKQKVQGLCFAKLKGNITISDMYFSQLTPGAELLLGEASLKVSNAQKECHGEACKFFQSGKECLIPEACRFAMVVESGRVWIGDDVYLNPHRIWTHASQPPSHSNPVQVKLRMESGYLPNIVFESYYCNIWNGFFVSATWYLYGDDVEFWREIPKGEEEE